MGYSRREVLGGLVGLLAPVKFAFSQQLSSDPQSEQFKYKVKFQIEDDYETNLQNHISSRYNGEVKGKVRVDPLSAIVEGTPEEIRGNFQRMLAFQNMPDVNAPNQALINLVAKLEQDPNYLNVNFQLNVVSPEDDGIIHKLGYVAKTGFPSDEHSLEFRAYKRQDGTLEVIQLTDYGITAGVHDDIIAGGLDFEIMYGRTRPGESARKILRVVPADESDKRTLYEVDILGHRKRLEAGLRKQNLRFTSDWKPVAQK